MMHKSKNLNQGKSKYLIAMVVLGLVGLILAAFTQEAENDYDYARREIVLRKIGHEVLLQSGDSSSRVLPIKKVGEQEYLISFENELTFNPDSLILLTKRILDPSPYGNHYVVNVLNCKNSTVAYGYAISQKKEENIVSCQGRIQPKACYLIKIQFKTASFPFNQSSYLLASLSILGVAGFIFLRSKKTSTYQELQKANQYQLGSILFDAENRKLITTSQTIELTSTETKVLRIFASAPNLVIERNRLQKEIWEDEGVIVGRSLDMFISKLRKKLEIEPKLKITVIRAKGYKLEIFE